jgi:hypothetical protein
MTETVVSRQAPGFKCRFPPDKVNKCAEGAGASAAVKYEDSRVEAGRLNSLHASRIGWLSGLLEGEGYFGIIPSHVGGQTYRYPRVGISMTDRDVIARVASIWTVGVQSDKKKPSRKQVYKTLIYGKRAAAWMYALLPLMGQRRREQIRRALKEWEERGPRAEARRSMASAERAGRLLRDSGIVPLQLSTSDTPRGRGHGARTTAEVVAVAKGLLAAGLRQVDVASATNLSSASMWAIKHEKWWRWVDAADVAWLLGGEGSQPTDGPNGTDRTSRQEGAATASPIAKGSRFQMKAGKQAESIRKELAKLDQRREALRRALAAYEDMDILDQAGRNSQQTIPQGTRSLRGAVLEVLCEAERPLRPKEIWARAQELGAATRSKNPAAVADLTAYQLQQSGVPIEKRDKAWSGDRRKLSVHLEKLANRGLSGGLPTTN